MYNLGRNLEIKRIGKDRLQLKINKEKAEVQTEDLAAVIRAELPEDRATELFSEIEEKNLSAGKARVVVAAQKRIEKGEEVCFTIDINKHLDRFGKVTGVRTTPNGIIF